MGRVDRRDAAVMTLVMEIGRGDDAVEILERCLALAGKRGAGDVAPGLLERRPAPQFTRQTAGHLGRVGGNRRGLLGGLGRRGGDPGQGGGTRGA